MELRSELITGNPVILDAITIPPSGGCSPLRNQEYQLELGNDVTLSRRDMIEVKIMNRVDVVHRGFVLNGVPSPCHEWTGPTSGSGRGGNYGRMCLDGQTVAVHLVRWTNKNGYIPGKKQLDHLCMNRLCCNDLHLELVTHKQNQKRRAKYHHAMKLEYKG